MKPSYPLKEMVDSQLRKKHGLFEANAETRFPTAQIIQPKINLRHFYIRPEVLQNDDEKYCALLCVQSVGSLKLVMNYFTSMTMSIFLVYFPKQTVV